MKSNKRYFKYYYLKFKHKLKLHSALAAFVCFAVGIIGLGIFQWASSWGEVKKSPSLFARWENVLPHRKDLNRTIASSEWKCRQDQSHFAELKEEVKQFEKQFPKTHPLRGLSYSVDWKDVSLPQAKYLKEFASTIGQMRPEVSACKHLTCLLNTKLEDESYEAGYMAYLWYLRTGYVLDFANSTAQWTKDDVRNFWWLSQAMPSQFKNIGEVRTLSKVEFLPQNKCYEYNSDKKEIKLSSQCLGTEFQDKKFSSTVAMSLADAGMYQIEKKYPHWKQYAGFELSGLSGYGGNVEKYWKNDGMSKTLPERELKHFMAEQISQFVFNGFEYDKFSKTKLFSFLKNYYFNGDTYSLGGALYTQLKNDLHSWRQKREEWLDKCVSTHASYFEEKPSRGIASLAKDHPVAQCLKQFVPSFIRDRQERLKTEHYLGCTFAAQLDNGKNLSDSYAAKLDDAIRKDITNLEWEMISQGKTWLSWYEVAQKFQEQAEPMNFYVKCSTAKSSKDCYENYLKENWRYVKQSLKGQSFSSQIFEENLVAWFPYEELDKEAQDKLSAFIEPFEVVVKNDAQGFWNSCKKEGAYSLAKPEIQGAFFSGGPHYIDGKFHNCLNQKADKWFSQEIEKTVSWMSRDYKKEFKLEADDKNYIKKELRKIASITWEEQLEVDKKAEEAKMDKYFSKEMPKIVEKLISEAQNWKEPEEMCFSRATFYFPKNLYFHTTKDVTQKVGRQICSQVLSRAQYN